MVTLDFYIFLYLSLLKLLYYIMYVHVHSINFFFVFFFLDLYRLTGERLGEGAYACVETCSSIYTDLHFAVKMISKVPGHSRGRVFNEVETFHYCQGHPNIIQLLEFFEDDTRFYLVFEKINGGQLLTRIQEQSHFTEEDASQIIRDLASALHFLHSRGI